MSEVDLKIVDLNLLVALDVLLEECHVTRSAQRLHLSQPAMSRTLARLRSTFDDPLLVRGPSGYEKTARAEALSDPLKIALGLMRRAFEKPTFDPGTAAGAFKICTLDYAEVVILPAFMTMVTRHAPDIMIEVIRRSVHSVEAIMTGAADISLGLAPRSPPKHCVVQNLFEERYVCMMHKNHPLASAELTLDRYLDYPHSIIHTGDRPGSFVDDAVERLGRRRKIAKRSPSFTASLMSVGESNLIQTVPRRLAVPLQKTLSLTIHELPFDLEPVVISQMWHARNTDDPSHKWFRDQISLVSEKIALDG